MILLIESGCYTFRSDRWNYISTEARDLVKSCLDMDEHKRITAEEALKHPWMTHYRTKVCKSENKHDTIPINDSLVQGFRNY